MIITLTGADFSRSNITNITYQIPYYEYTDLYVETGTSGIKSSTGARMFVFNVEKNTNYELRVLDYCDRFRIGFSTEKRNAAITPTVGTTISYSIQTAPGLRKFNSGEYQTVYVYFASASCSTVLTEANTSIFTPPSNNVDYFYLRGWAMSGTGGSGNVCRKEDTYVGQESIAFNCEANTSYTIKDAGQHDRFRIYGRTESYDVNINVTVSLPVNSVIYEGNPSDTEYTFNSGSNHMIIVYLNSGSFSSNKCKVTITKG